MIELDHFYWKLSFEDKKLYIHRKNKKIYIHTHTYVYINVCKYVCATLYFEFVLFNSKYFNKFKRKIIFFLYILTIWITVITMKKKISKIRYRKKVHFYWNLHLLQIFLAWNKMLNFFFHNNIYKNTTNIIAKKKF